jgi:glycosyltransferase involved in cell wall biosynthesis
MKKILHVVEAFGGGMFMHIANLSNQLCKDFDVYIAYGIRPQTHKNFPSFFDKRIHLIEIVNFRMEINPLKDFKAAIEIRDLCKQIKPDVVHLHSSKAGVIGRLALNGYKRPLYYTPHGWAFLRLEDSIYKRLFYKWIERVCAFRHSTIVATSHGEYSEALSVSKHVTQINNGVCCEGLDTFKVDESIPLAPIVYTIGRICFQKNPSLFNEIALKLPTVKFVWIGDGDMKNVITSPNIQITGWGPRDEALEMTKGYSIFLLPSLWEGMPLALLEAMYLRKLCIVSNSIGNRDVIKNEYNGFIANTVDEYVDLIRKALTGGLDLKMILDNGERDVNNEFNTNVMARKYVELYLGTH